MKTEEIEVGATYRFGGYTKWPKRVTAYDPQGRYAGGTVRARVVRDDGTVGNIETFAGDYFASKAIEKVQP